MGGKDLQFSFNFETKNKLLAEIHNLDNKKDCRQRTIGQQVPCLICLNYMIGASTAKCINISVIFP